MIQIIDKSKCCGCTACASICTHDAISMQPDILGFPYPIVDSNKCIDCGLCEKVCSFNDHYDISQNLPQPLVYAVRHKNTHEIEKRSSYLITKLLLSISIVIVLPHFILSRIISLAIMVSTFL